MTRNDLLGKPLLQAFVEHKDKVEMYLLGVRLYIAMYIAMCVWLKYVYMYTPHNLIYEQCEIMH